MISVIIYLALLSLAAVAIPCFICFKVGYECGKERKRDAKGRFIKKTVCDSAPWNRYDTK